MAEVISFPNATPPDHASRASDTDPPLPDYRSIVIEMENEIVEYTQTICEQAIRLKRYRRGSVSLPKFSAAILVAFACGLQLDAPDVASWLTPAQAVANVIEEAAEPVGLGIETHCGECYSI